MIPIHTRTDLSFEIVTSITNDIGHINTLDRLLTHHGAENILMMLNQDEFTIDVVVKYDEVRYLVYDVT